MSEIQALYNDKTVFLTGGTGFIGKLIIQKLLKTTDVKAIYVIIRAKRGLTVAERTRQLLEHEIFSNVKHKISKVKAFAGDLAKLGLGLTEEGKETLQRNTDIIIHCGAHLSMASGIQESVFSNVRSTREILGVAKNCEKLISFVYVSTAYSNCPRSVIEEKFFEAPVNSDLLIKMAEKMDDQTLERISSGLRGPWPNYYCFTKAVSESLIQDAVGIMPVGLFRPSIITSTAEEPLVGWTDNLYGPMGIVLSINVGLLRVLRSLPSVKLDLVPADKVTNAILCTAWEIAKRWEKRKEIDFVPPVMNFSGKNSRIYVDLKYLRDNTKVAMKSAIWYPICFLIYNPILFVLLHKLLHTIPYYTMDKIAVLQGKKPTASRLFKKVTNACEALYFFMTHEWTIQNDNVVALWNQLNDVDRRTYNFDVTGVRPEQYFQAMATGLKQFLAKETLSDMAQHVKKQSWLKMIHYIFVGLLLVLFFAGIKYLFRLLMYLT